MEAIILTVIGRYTSTRDVVMCKLIFVKLQNLFPRNKPVAQISFSMVWEKQM